VETAEANVCLVKADPINRVVAKFIDLFLCALLTSVLVSLANKSTLPFFGNLFAFVTGAAYILFADGLYDGRSLGKRFIGLRVIKDPLDETPHACDFRHSLIRNIPFVIITPAFSLGLFGLFVSGLGFLLVGFETYFIWVDDQGIRLGDIFASTKVLAREKI